MTREVQPAVSWYGRGSSFHGLWMILRSCLVNLTPREDDRKQKTHKIWTSTCSAIICSGWTLSKCNSKPSARHRSRFWFKSADHVVGVSVFFFRANGLELRVVVIVDAQCSFCRFSYDELESVGTQIFKH